MWNFTALDTSATTNRRPYFRSGVTLKASSTAKETFYPVIRAPSNFSPSTHAPSHAPARTSHRSPSRATYPTAPRTPSHRRAHPTATRPHHHHPSPMSHVIPPGPHSSTARKPQNINDPISNPETSSRELRAKLLRAWAAGPGRQHANDRHARLKAAAGPTGQ